MSILKKQIIHICVNYKNDEDTKKFIASLEEQSQFSESVLVIIANNSASSLKDSTFNTLTQRPNVLVMNFPDNPGYFGAAQKVYTQLIQQHYEFDWVILSNTDLHFLTHDFYSLLNKTSLNKNAHLGMLAPSIISGISHKETNPFMQTRPSSLRMFFYRVIFSNLITCQAYQILGYLKASVKNHLSPSKKTISSATPSSLSPSEIYAPHGAFMIFHSNYFQAGLDFSHPCFLYGEEISSAEKCRIKNLKVLMVPELKVFHIEHGSEGVKSYLFKFNTFQFKKDSSRAIYKEYFS